MREGLGSSLQQGKRELEAALAILRRRLQQADQRLEAAEFGRHGQADLIGARDEERARLQAACDALETALEALEEAARLAD